MATCVAILARKPETKRSSTLWANVLCDSMDDTLRAESNILRQTDGCSHVQECVRAVNTAARTCCSLLLKREHAITREPFVVPPEIEVLGTASIGHLLIMLQKRTV